MIGLEGEGERERIEQQLKACGRPGPYYWDTGIGSLKGGDLSIEISVRSGDGYTIGFAVRIEHYESERAAATSIYRAIVGEIERVGGRAE